MERVGHSRPLVTHRYLIPHCSIPWLFLWLGLMIQNRTSAGREEQPVHSTIEPVGGNYGETFDYKT